MESYWSRLNRRIARRRLLAAGGALSLGTAAVALAGCGGGGGGTTSRDTATGDPGTPERGGSYGQTYGASDNLNILTNPAEYAGLGGQFVYDHLISTRTNENAPFVLEAAEALEQPDNLTLTFKLRKGMTYHPFPPVNGREVVAEDVVKMQEFARSLQGIENNFQVNFLDRATAPDKYTVVYRLKEPRAYLFDSRILGHPGPQAIIPHETFDNLHSARQIGSGPFMADNWTINSRYHYVRFDKYHSRGKAPGTLPYRDATDVLILSDAASLEAAFRSEQIHYYVPQPGQFESILSSMGGRAKAVEFQSLSPFTWNMNMTRQPFTDIRFRQAMYRATNRQQFIDLLYNGKAQAPTGILSAAMKPYQLEARETEQYFKHDPAEGRRLIQAMGWDTNKEIALMFSGTTINAQGAEILKQQVAQIGVRLRPDPKQGIAEMSPLTLRNEYEMFIGGHPGYDTPSVPLRHNHSQPFHQFAVSGLRDPEMDALIEKAEKTPDFQENVKLVKQIQLELIKRYTSYYNILSPTTRALLNAKIQNFEVEASNVAMHRADMWIKRA